MTALHFVSFHVTSLYILWFAPHFHFSWHITYLTFFLKCIGIERQSS
jgi:hypothetical protein